MQQPLILVDSDDESAPRKRRIRELSSQIERERIECVAVVSIAHDRAQKALDSEFIARINAAHIVCAAACGCDPRTERLLKFEECNHFICERASAAIVLKSREHVRVDSTMLPGVMLSCPLCRTTSRLTVHKATLPVVLPDVSITISQRLQHLTQLCQGKADA